MLTFATGLILASTMTTTTGYPRLGVAMLLLGAGLGLSSAPATESIMGSLPRNRAGVGSARQRHRPRSRRRARRRHRRQHRVVDLPEPSRRRIAEERSRSGSNAAHDSLGGALHVSSALGTDGVGLVTAAQEAFVAAMSRASIVTALVAVVGAIVAWRYLPARAAEDAETSILAGGSAVVRQRSDARGSCCACCMNEHGRMQER